MSFKGAIVDRDGKAYSIFMVDAGVLLDQDRGQKALQRLSSQFPHLPVCLMARSSSGDILRLAKPSTAAALSDLLPDGLDWSDLEGMPG